MQRITQRTTVLLAVGSLLALFACATDTTPEPASEKPDSEFRAVPGEPTEPLGGSGPAGGAGDFGTAYFDYDSSSIRADARPVLRANAEALRRDGTRVTIEGHCDDRGDEEYNLALGERRAAAVKRYLANLGVAAGNMRTLSYGEAKPAAKGSNESAWRWNRRAEFRAR